MFSSVLDGEPPYRVLFPTKSLFPIAPKIFGHVCFVWDICLYHTKLDPKILEIHLLGLFMRSKRLSLLLSYSAFITSLDSTSIPNTVHEAFSHPSWSSAMIEEMIALDDNGTWDLVNPNGTVARLKARLVAKKVDYWVTVEQVLFCLKVAPGHGILYKDHGHMRVNCYSDADWAGSREDRRSTSSYCVFVGGNLVSWKSKKQNVVSRSSVESEYRAMAQSVCTIVWVQLLSEIGFSITMPAKLWCDNQVALHIASNLVFHEQTKNIKVDCHFIHEKIQDKIVFTGYVKTGEQLGDIFTEVVDGARISYLCNKLGMIDIFAPA
ncbi:putative mitochondrial protein [Cucumis melo var. makuwa]|uniref:Mitochondrial protein n=1 Tax=Cucumis melo var. makuwa TaxID=1194695 RepID=A0A5D3CVN0_CUCMM|nr:putative mitochondrial protein [Cucumis melo var. makuwa]TYK14456.1 putative mitochondrial protein [Cucumis melo var. makuwa]